MKKELPSPELLRKLLRYDSETGQLFWRERPRQMFSTEQSWKSWNAKNSGCLALNCKNSHDYLHGTVLGRSHKAHRVAWIIYFESIPDFQIDHVNGVRSDNRICNLRLATPAQNAQNQCRRKDNSSGVVGVSWHVAREKWSAQIGQGGRQIYLGVYSKLDDAIAARKMAEKRYGYHENHGRYVEKRNA